MPAPSQSAERTRWIVSVAAAGAVMAGMGVLFRSPAPAAPAAAADGPKTSLEIARPGPEDDLLRQEAELRDLRPLFLSTARNAVLREPRREPGRSVLDEAERGAKFSDTEIRLERNLPPPATIGGQSADKATPADGLGLETDLSGVAGFGRRDTVGAALPKRGGYLEIVATGDGRSLGGGALPVAAAPPTDKPWTPLEFLATVDASGLAVPLVLRESSRVDEVDAHFRKYLTTEFRIGARLPPGFYRITVAP